MYMYFCIPMIYPWYHHSISMISSTNLPNNISRGFPQATSTPEAVTRPTSARCPSPIACDPLAPPVAWTAGARAWPCASVPGWCRPSWRRMCCGCWGRRIWRAANCQAWTWKGWNFLFLVKSLWNFQFLMVTIMWNSQFSWLNHVKSAFFEGKSINFLGEKIQFFPIPSSHW